MSALPDCPDWCQLDPGHPNVHKATHETAGLAAQVIATGPARDLNVSCLIIFKQQPDEAAVNRLLQLLELVGRLDDRKQQALIDLAGIAVP